VIEGLEDSASLLRLLEKKIPTGAFFSARRYAKPSTIFAFRKKSKV
jgi:hypothetical protein